MKETKVYVNELPHCCRKCVCYSEGYEEGCLCNLEAFDCMTCEYDKIYNQDYKHKNCPLKLIKTHDRELVKEVCEKIKLKFSDTRSHNWGIEQFELYEFLEQIQIEVVEE